MSRLRARRERARTSEDYAWACLVTNAVGVPGLGTLMAGRGEGVPQLLLAAGGGVLLTWWLVQVVMAALAGAELPLLETDLRLAGGGGVLFTAAWAWGLASSLITLRAARARPAPTMGEGPGRYLPSGDRRTGRGR